MAAIFHDMVIGFGGQSYTIKPTFEIINRIEQPSVNGGLGISLAGLSSRSSRGEVAITEIVRILAFLLRTQGVALDDEEMYVEVMNSGDRIKEIISMVTTAFFPVVRPAKDDEESKKK